MNASASLAAREDGGDGGFTLVELLVAISIFAVLAAVVFSGLTSTVKTVEDVRSITNLTQQARLAMERITRELRQAKEITGYHVATASASENYTSVTFWVDFNGNGARDQDAVDPEIITYRFQPQTGELLFIPSDTNSLAEASPILAANVTDFRVSLTSSLWEHDTDHNGVTDWTEIDKEIGNGNGTLEFTEFKKIDSIEVAIQLLDGARTQTFKTQVNLRNQSQS